MQSLRPTFLPSRHVQPGWRALVSRHQKVSVIQVSSSGGGGGLIGGGGGFGGGDDGDFEDPSFNFNLLSILTVISEPEKAIHSIAELALQEQDNSQEQEISEEEEEEDGYVKPAPKPKAEKMSLGPMSSILFLLFLLSGGFFFWRRSRTRSSPSLSREGLIQRTREICLSPEEEVQKETEEQDCYLMTDLEEKDEFFNVERSENTIPTELVIPQKQEILKKTEASEETEIESLMEVKEQQEVQNLAEGLEFAKTVEATTEQYYADLEAKDSFFNSAPKTEFLKAQLPRTEFSKTEVKKTEFPKTSDQEPTDASVPIPGPPETSEIEQDHEDPSNRQQVATSPVSNNDEGSNQSCLTNFNENGASSVDPDLTLKDLEAEENKPPQKYLPMDDEVDLGPPIKPKGFIFDKDLSWEEEGLFPGGKTPMNEKNHTMAYLLSRPDLLEEVVKQMESKPQKAKEEGQIKKAAEVGKRVSGGSQKKKKRGKKSRR